jgi:hypothetical protein
MFGLFASKIECFACGKKVKEKESFFRRHMRFCGEPCATRYAAANPVLVRAVESPEQTRQSAEARLLAMAGELVAALAAAGSSTSMVYRGSAVGAGLAVARLEDVQQCMHRFDAHVLDALPYLYALGMTGHAARLECIDLDPIHNLSSIGSGPAQQKRIRAYLEPIGSIVSGLLGELERR